MDCKLPASLRFRDTNKYPYYTCNIIQILDDYAGAEVYTGFVRVYYSLEKDQFEVIPIHISEEQVVDDERIKYNPDLYIDPFFVMNESHFNCTIFRVLNSWDISSKVSEDYLFPFRVRGHPYLVNFPLCTTVKPSFHSLKDHVRKMHDQDMHRLVTKMLVGKIPVPNEVVNIITDNAFPMARS